MIETWDFADQALNGTPSLINRQKSADNLVVLSLDERTHSATFLDPEKKIQSLTTLATCDCRDFHFVGKSPRKTFQPCKHIYRLAMELGLLAPTYFDHAARERERLLSLSELKQNEDVRLRSLGRDPTVWGAWPIAIHESGLQKNRQYRAYFLLDDEPTAIEHQGSRIRVHEYACSLHECACPDFADRQLPCKHIYAVALKSGQSVPLDRALYLQGREQGLEILFEFPVVRRDPLSRL